VTPRDELTAYLHRQLVGPAGAPDEVLEGPPDRRYLLGVLYPQEADLHGRLNESAELLDGNGIEPDEDDSQLAEDPLPESNAWLPSSIGISFYTDAATLMVECSAARYRTEKGRRRSWHRIPMPTEQHDVFVGDDKVKVLEGRAEIRVLRRPLAGGDLVTVALANSAAAADDDRAVDDMLFQVGLKITAVDGRILEYPEVRLMSRDPEEQELRLQYRHVRTHAVGNGCAVVEQAHDTGTVTGVAASFMPQADVPAIHASGPASSPALRIPHLADPAVPVEELRGELAEFASLYRAWYEEQSKAELPGWGSDAAVRVVKRIGAAVDRIESGIATLFDPDRPELLRAFRFANHAMAMQMRHSEDDQAGKLRTRIDPVELDPPIREDATWYPFQLAFFLLALDGVADPRHPDREVADLIWFPTGGGKTEAYLLLAAFVMALRRNGSGGGGTAVLSRYTLSLLTTQQFQRAAGTVCALETIRADHESELGTEPFSIGLWVGEATSPNSYAKAAAVFQEERDAQQPEGKFILDRCPWCGTRIMPEFKSADDREYGVRCPADGFEFFCPREECRFHESLPVSVVDQDLYDRPPTFVLGTVDKFARLAWERQSGRLFGAGTGNAPPSLVIQDELHLLTGPLGSTVGLYESAVIGLCTADGIRPKVIASTATIRRADDQIRALYGTETQVFPPQGVDARNSYFAKEDPDPTRSRRYLGVMAPGHTAGRATVAVAAAMLHGAAALPEPHRDDYWTLVAYHQSLRELGRTVTAASDDIPAELKSLIENGIARELPQESVEELSSRRHRFEQPGILDRLGKPRGDRRAVSLVPCTNMLSVGVDVKRLAYMLMLGQPKTTSEYIQASARVGRSKVPGLVVTFLNATRPRDRSHYEAFGVYHRSLYRHVEPTSVTPWSVPSRRRALHAALVIMVRHRLGLTDAAQAGELLDRLPEAEQLADEIADWARRSGGDLEDVREDLRQLLSEWVDLAETAIAEGKPLYYDTASKQYERLLKGFEQPRGAWATPRSMRNVDRECKIESKGIQR
jgi:hypothetical protein